jgi:hypothetical protein
MTWIPKTLWNAVAGTGAMLAHLNPYSYPPQASSLSSATSLDLTPQASMEAATSALVPPTLVLYDQLPLHKRPDKDGLFHAVSKAHFELMKNSKARMEGRLEWKPNGNPPSQVAPLSVFDSSIVKDWAGEMSVTYGDDSSITYKTDTGAVQLLASDSSVTLSVLNNMTVTVVTPGIVGYELKVGDVVQLSAAQLQYLWVAVQKPKGAEQTVQDRIYFYQTGMLAAGPKLFVNDIFESTPQDVLMLGINNPQWQSNISPVLFTPGTFVPTVNDTVVTECAIWTAYVVELVVTGAKTDALEMMRERRPKAQVVGNLQAFYPANTANYGYTIAQYIDTIDSIDKAAEPLFVLYQVTPLMDTILTMALVELAQRDDPNLHVYLTGINRAVNYGWYTIIVNPGNVNDAQLHEAAWFFSAAIDLEVPFDYLRLQGFANDPQLLTVLYLVFNTMTPWAFWFTDVSDKVNQEYPIPDVCKILIGLGNGSYKDLFPKVKENLEAAREAIVVCFRRAISNVTAGTNQEYAIGSLRQQVENLDATIYPAKSLVLAGNTWDYIILPGMFRYCTDVAASNSTSLISAFMAKSDASASNPSRLYVAQTMTMRLIQTPTDDNLYAMLDWFPPWLGAYAAENLDAVGVKHSIKVRGANPFQASPCLHHSKWMLQWLDLKFPPAQMTVTAVMNDAPPYGNFYGDNVAYRALNITGGSVALVFEAPWEGLDPSDLKDAVLQKGTETYVVQSNADGTANVYIAKCETRRLVYHIATQASTVTLLGNTDWKPWSMERIGVNKGDWLLVMDDPYNQANLVTNIGVAIKGIIDPTLLAPLINGLLYKVADAAFTFQ